MKHIRQRGKVDCGLAVAAMVAGVSYRVAMEVEREWRRKGMRAGDLRGLLIGLDGRGWLHTRRWRMKPVETFVARGRCAVLITRLPMSGDDGGHWVAVDDEGWLHDPSERERTPLRAYASGWVVCSVIEAGNGVPA